MVEAKQIDQWNHTASVITALIKLNVGKKAKDLKPQHIHPFTAQSKSGKTVMPKHLAYERLHAMVGVKRNGKS
jgi:hypothetical protein